MPEIEVLLVEDNRADIILLQEALTQAGIAYRLNVVEDGVAAMEFLRQQKPYTLARRPALIILDLNLPLKDGRQVLSEIAPDLDLRQIPLVILTSSTTDQDIVCMYGLPDGCYMIKPFQFDGYVELAKAIEAFRQRAAGPAAVV